MPDFLPNTESGLEGQVSNSPVSLLDLYPTLLDLAGLPANSTNEGESLKLLVEGAAETSGHVAITSYGFNNHAIRDERYRYIHYIDGSEEMYEEAGLEVRK